MDQRTDKNRNTLGIQSSGSFKIDKSKGLTRTDEAHKYSDVDTDRQALHHTLGPGPYQAAPGNHEHAGIVPIGGWIIWPTDPLPPGDWLRATSDMLLIADYPELFKVYGNQWGGDGITTFQLPGIGNRMLIMAHEVNFPVGTRGGNNTYKLTTANLPQHSHGAGSLTAASNGAHTHQINRKDGVGNSSGLAQGDATSIANWPTESSGSHSHNVTGSTGNAGSADPTPIDTLPAWFAVWFIIRAK